MSNSLLNRTKVISHQYTPSLPYQIFKKENKTKKKKPKKKKTDWLQNVLPLRIIARHSCSSTETAQICDGEHEVLTTVTMHSYQWRVGFSGSTLADSLDLFYHLKGFLEHCLALFSIHRPSLTSTSSNYIVAV